MANKQIVDYIKEAQGNGLKKAEIIHNLKDAGWNDANIRDGFSYINLYPGQAFVYQTQTGAEEGSRHKQWISLVSIVLGYLWVLSGLNKILGGEFAPGFADFVRSQIANGQLLEFYKGILNSFVLPNASWISQAIQYSELGVGVLLIIGGIWSFFPGKRWLNFVLCLVSVGSFFMILNIILSLGLGVPWIDTNNAYASGLSAEYLVLLLSAALVISYFNEL